MWCPPGEMGGHVHKKVLRLGRTDFSFTQVHREVQRLSKEWPGSDYKLLTHNCQTFAVIFSEQLGLGPDVIPADLRRFANSRKHNRRASSSEFGGFNQIGMRQMRTS